MWRRDWWVGASVVGGSCGSADERDTRRVKGGVRYLCTDVQVHHNNTRLLVYVRDSYPRCRVHISFELKHGGRV